MFRIFILLVIFFVFNSAVAEEKVLGGKFEHFRDCDVCSEMIVLPSGKYMMGATDDEFRGQGDYRSAYIYETPRHEERVESFALAVFDVTRKQFAEFAKATGFAGKGCYIFNGRRWVADENADWLHPGFIQTDNDPVVCVSWDDAQKYIAWLNEKLPVGGGIKYRLPTEVEWEYAARAGTVTATYWGGGNIQEQCQYENTRDQSGARILGVAVPYADCTDGYVETSPVGAFRPNPWGFFDMLGNVGQWVADCPQIGYPARSTITKPDITCTTRGIRGASWASIPIGVRAASRGGLPPGSRESIYGFRLAANSKK